MTVGAGYRKRRAQLKKERHQRTSNLVTPEGVELGFLTAKAGDRAAAFLIDGFIIALSIFLAWLIVFALSLSEVAAVVLVFSFLLRNFYFTFFERRWQGATPGKRLKGLRVIDAQGGQLTVEAVIVRNLTRELEIFMPLMALVMPSMMKTGHEVLMAVLALVWILVMAFMPFFNGQRRRVGDLVAGTMVIETPEVVLLEDLVESAAQGRVDPQAFEFTPDQLSHYGVYELQVLEEVLRRETSRNTAQDLADIADRIRKKLDWTGDVSDEHTFLQAFYAAQRAHLESGLLMGRRREDKFADENTSS